MQPHNKMKSISGYISKATWLLLTLVVLSLPLSGQESDTLRTFGPRIGLDLAKFLYYFSEPAEYGAEISGDFD